MADWITPNRALNNEEMKHNAILFYKRFGDMWSKNAIYATLGNMQAESSINPGRWQMGFKPYAKSAGYGLTQWTPWTKYANWAGKNWEANGDLECDRIEYEWRNGLQWVKNIKMSFAEYAQSNASVEYLAEVFVRNYERPKVVNVETRAKAARYWHDYFEGMENPPDIPSRPPQDFKGVLIPVLFRMKEKRDKRGKPYAHL